MSEKEFICPECGKSFDTPQGLGAHRARTHGYRSNNGVEEEVVPTSAELRVRLEEMNERSPLFEDQLLEFLPRLADEALNRLRDGDDSFVEPFLVLYLDAH